MNNFQIAWKLFSINPLKKRFNFVLLIPYFGITISIFIFLTTIGIMDGMESIIYNDIKKIISNDKIKINKNQESRVDELANYLKIHNIEFYKIIENKCLLKYNEEIRILNVIAVDRLNDYLKLKFNINKSVNKNGIILGKGLVDNLMLNINTIIEIITPNGINMLTSIPKKKDYIVENTFEIKVLNFDSNYGYIKHNDDNISTLGKNNQYLYFPEKIPKKVKEFIYNNFSDINIIHWKDEYNELINAMNLEKLLYSFFGVIIMILSCFTLSNIMSNTVYRKLHQFALLKVCGYSQTKLQIITLHYTSITGIISVLLGVLLAYIFLSLNNEYNILKYLFNDIFFIEFPIILSFSKVIITIVMSNLVVMLSGFYSTYYINKMKLIDSINYLR